MCILQVTTRTVSCRLAFGLDSWLLCHDGTRLYTNTRPPVLAGNACKYSESAATSLGLLLISPLLAIVKYQP